MRKTPFVVVASLIVLLAFGACTKPTAEVAVDPANVYTEKNDGKNGDIKGVEKTGLSVKESVWMAFQGTFGYIEDEDYYRVEIGDTKVNRIAIQAVNDGKVDTGVFGIPSFPMETVLYDKKGKVLMNVLLSVSGFNLEPGTSYMIFHVHAKGTDTGKGAYVDGPYMIKMKGEVAAPKASTSTPTSSP